MLSHCESFISSKNPLLHAAAVGFLLEGKCLLSPRQRAGVQQRAELWVDAMSLQRLDEIEEAAVLEVGRITRKTAGVDLSKLSAVDRLVLRNERRILEAVNLVLQSRDRMCVESHLTSFDDVFPPEPDPP